MWMIIRKSKYQALLKELDWRVKRMWEMDNRAERMAAEIRQLRQENLINIKNIAEVIAEVKGEPPI